MIHNTQPPFPAFSLGRDLAIILGTATTLTIFALMFDWDKHLAIASYNPNAQWAWQVRQWSNWPGFVISLTALAFLVLWPLRQRFETLRALAVIWLVAVVIGGGLLNQVLAKELAQRPRPRETEILGGTIPYSQDIAQRAELKGKSFPSGHVTMGIIFAAPFFVLRRRQRKLALLFLVTGLAAAGIVGFARMTLGAHFFTDVLWGSVITLALAAIAARFYDGKRDFPNFITLPFLASGLLALILFNKFTLELTWQPENAPPTQPITLNTPCTAVHFSPSETLNIRASLTGSGAPLSNLVLAFNAQNNTLSLVRHWGIYRNLNCNLRIALPANAAITIPPTWKITSEVPGPVLLHQSSETLVFAGTPTTQLDK